MILHFFVLFYRDAVLSLFCDYGLHSREMSKNKNIKIVIIMVIQGQFGEIRGASETVSCHTTPHHSKLPVSHHTTSYDYKNKT